MEWSYSAHAMARMRQRRILPEQVDALLKSPANTLPDPKRQEGCRMYVGGGITAIVNEDDAAVLTVGIHGASRNDWESFRAPALSVLDGGRMTGTRARRTSTSRKRKPAPEPVAKRNVLDDVHPGIAKTVRAELRRRKLDFRAVRVLSPTEVEVLCRYAS